MTRAAIYARYSSDLQSDSSIEDQVRSAKELAQRQGWDVVDSCVYADHAISGASMIRPAMQMMLQDAQAGKFDVVVAEALDRMSRDQADVATIRKRLLFAGVGIHTISEGEISELHIGLKGTMNALFLKDLAVKTRRGLRGRVENGKSGGGLPFGYRVKTVGEFEIDEEQAAIVVRIFEEYAAGCSPKRIAAMLNRENIPNTSGQGWSQSTLNGNVKRGTGVLNNEIYIGRRVWNKTRKVKDPDTGVRLSRANPPEEWIINEVPELRIIEQDLWDRVKARQKLMSHSGPEQLWTKRRPTNLLSFMLKCGECGGGFAKSNQTGYSCSTAMNKGTCGNRLRIRQDVLEEAVLDSLRANLMAPELCEEFCKEYTEHVNRLRSERNATLHLWQAERDKLQKRRDQIVKAIGDGFATQDLKVEFNALVARRDELDRLLKETPRAPVMLHPSMSEKYRKEVSKLTDMLRDKQRGAEAGDILRSLIDKIVLTPNAERDALVVDLYGDLAGIINLALSADKEGSKSRINAACCPATVEALNHFRMSELSAVAAGGGGFQPIDSSARIVGSPSSGRFAS